VCIRADTVCNESEICASSYCSFQQIFRVSAARCAIAMCCGCTNSWTLPSQHSTSQRTSSTDRSTCSSRVRRFRDRIVLVSCRCSSRRHGCSNMFSSQLHAATDSSVLHITKSPLGVFCPLSIALLYDLNFPAARQRRAQRELRLAGVSSFAVP
jgi:hypothetical protein